MFIENVESSLPFVATTGRGQQRRATICGLGKYFFFLVLARARSVKLVSGVFHYWSSPSTKIVCTQGWLFASLFFTLIKICINIVSFSKCVYVYWSYYWEGKFIQFLSSNDENAKSLLITGNFVSCSSEFMPIF